MNVLIVHAHHEPSSFNAALLRTAVVALHECGHHVEVSDGIAYGGGRRFGTGLMRGKRAMCIVTVGGLPSDYDGSGAYAPMEQVL